MTSHRSIAIVLAALAILATGCGGKKTRVAKPARIGSTETGIASWYGHPYHGRRAANGEIYDMEKLTAAHRTLPFGTWLRVRNLENDRTVDVRIQDRGPFIDKRIIDLSRAAAEIIDMIRPGIVKVKLTVIEQPDNPDAQIAAVRHSEPGISPAEMFAVQVGAFSGRGRAEEMARDMRRRYGPARIAVRNARTVIYRVLVGEEAYIEDAQALMSRIQLDGITAFVVRLDDSPEDR